MVLTADFETLGRREKALEEAKVIIDFPDTTIKGVKAILAYDGRNIHGIQECSQVLVSMILFSQLGKYRGKGFTYSSTTDFLDKTNTQNAEVLAYTADKTKYVPIEGYKHRFFSVAQILRERNPGIAKQVYDTHNIITPLEKEVTYIPSLLLFYIKQGFSINKIHISNHTDNNRPYFPSYDIDDRQKGLILQIIYDFLSKGDIALPFFVELTKEQSDSIITPEVDKKVNDYFSHIADLIDNEMGKNPGYSLMGDERLRKMEDILRLPHWDYSTKLDIT